MLLGEGLKTGDLDDLVLKTISIDEFHSKLDDEKAIVVAFYVDDKDPASDLSRFIEKSALEFLDTEVSPAPNENGRYLVFVEFMRNAEFPKQLVRLLEILVPLTSNKNYRFKPYKDTKTYPCTEQHIKTQIRLIPKVTNESLLLKYLEDSMLHDARLIQGKLILDEHQYPFAGFGPSTELLRKLKLTNKPFNLLESSRESTRISGMLGPKWTILRVEDYIIAQYQNNDSVLALGPIDKL